MPIKGVKLCGAKCRTKGGAPCHQAAMKNGRCRMHGGSQWKREKHGRATLQAKAARKSEQTLLRELKGLSADIEKSPQDDLSTLERLKIYQKVEAGKATPLEMVRLSLAIGMISQAEFEEYLEIERFCKEYGE